MEQCGVVGTGAFASGPPLSNLALILIENREVE
jgi:hypothetical protein